MSPLVSVHIITYNQKNFISEAIESVLSQTVGFPIEIVIGDDNSTDGTREILLSYKKKYPDKIILNLLAEKGSGMAGRLNFETTLKLCKGEYIAFLDGDDYWTNNNKLNLQVEFLKNNDEFVMCHHDCESKLTEGVSLKKEFNKKNKISSFYEACQMSIPFMSSVLIRKYSLDYFDREKLLEGFDLGDFVFWTMASLKGKAYYIDSEMAYYRVNAGSITKSLGYEVQVRNRLLLGEKLLDTNYSFDRKFMKRFLCKYYFQYSGIWLSRKKFFYALKFLMKSTWFYIAGISFKKREYEWVKRLKWNILWRIYFAHCVKAFKAR